MESLKENNELIKRFTKSNCIVMITCAFLSFLFLLLCSRSSFLYSYNNWDDANSYFSMGKYMMNGGVIYRDLYDQKGPYLYFLYGIAYLLSNNTFGGVFVLEVLAVSIFLFYGYKILCLYTTRRAACLLLPILAAVCFSSLSFYWGGAAEEFCLPMLMVSLYSTMRYFKKEYPKPPQWKMILWNGIFAGIILQLKYTLLGFYFSWMAVIVIMNFRKETWKKSLQCCFIFLAGIILPTLPWLIYFGYHNALDDWFRCYVYNNVFLYSDMQKTEITLWGKIYKLAKILYNLIWDNFCYFLFIIIGYCYIIFSKFSKWYEKVNSVLLFIFLFLGIYIGGADIFYYSIPLFSFSVLGLGAMGRIGNSIKRRLHREFIPEKYYSLLFIFVAAGALYFANGHSINTEYRKLEKEEHFLWKFEQIVKREENPTLLNINMLDAGLYTAANIIPSCEYFQTNGIDLEEMRQEQEHYIKEGRTLFVISRFHYPEYILEKYDMVAEISFATDGKNKSPYFLFRLKEEKIEK